MQSQCPTSTFYSIAVLRNHRWFVNERGYANIVPSIPGQKGVEDVVWGVLYTLRPFDEELLDKHEGIPWAYSKEDMDVEVITIAEDGRGTRREVVRALVYIDRERVQESYPWPEFVVKMNKGIQDAVERGIPRTWVDRVVRSYIADPSMANGSESQAENGGVASAFNGPQAVPTTKPESDRASHTQGSVVGAQSMNGTLQPAQSSLPIHSSGLEKSKYAYEGSTTGAQQGKGSDERDPNRPSKKSTNAGAQSHGNKQLECWWWKVKGSCRFPDEQCMYAHYDTGSLAPAPGKKQKDTPLNEKNLATQPKNPPRRGKSPSKAKVDKQYNQHPYGYAQGWSGQQGKTAELPTISWSEQKPKAEATNTPRSAEQPEVEAANPSWSDQVENLMDSQPEWLVANDRNDVKW